MPVNFQPSGIFVEYHSQFLIVSNEIRTIGLGLKIRIDRCWNCHKRIEFAGYLRFIVSTDVARCSRNYMINPRSKFSITYSLSLEYNKNFFLPYT